MPTLTRENRLTAPTRNTHNSWAAVNPVLPEGVLAITKDRLYAGSIEYFIGDGVSNYNALRKFGEAKDAAGKIDLANVVTNSANGLLKLGADGNVPAALTNAANKLLKLDANGKAPAERLYITGALTEGNIIESGENANGQYIKWADGTMICKKHVSNPYPVTSPWGALYINSDTNIGAWPAAFCEVPYVSGCGALDSGGSCMLSFMGEISPTIGPMFSMVRPTVMNSNGWGFIIAIGRWK